ncbi:MAG: class I SAM-dependent methyltransferase [Anaerolineae bacterium]|nr:class I SAM-dependent methyltransferase [Anaerolineae bacterium]
MRDVVAWIVFVVVQIPFIPLAIFGIALSLYTQTIVSKRLGVSGTAANVAAERMLMDRFGLRADRASGQLLRTLPNVSMIGGWLILFPWYLRYKISGKNAGFPALSTSGKETVANMMPDRTVAIDRIIQKSSEQVEQFVSLGAGYDTRCYGSLKNSRLQFFELDQAATQRLKRVSLQKAGIDASHVHFVEVDFSVDNWIEGLRKSNYDPSKPALFLWEGVTLYLSEDAVRETLRAIKSVAAPGSILVSDFYARRFVTGEYSSRGHTITKAAGMSDEELGFGLDFSQDYAGVFASFLAGENLVAGDTYFMGAKTKKGVFMVVAEIKL